MEHSDVGWTATRKQAGTVFIVDDEMMVTTSLQTMLALETDHRIHCFNSPLEALEKLDLKPDVVISDFSMPGMDGINFLREVKKRLEDCTLILLTGYADKESAIEAINTVGIYRYIEKPWDNEELKLSISNGLERSRLISDLRQSVQDLTAAQTELERTNQRLEALVEERTQDLKATYQKLNGVIRNSADGILLLDQGQRITLVNPAAERLFQAAYGPQPILNTPLGHWVKTSGGKLLAFSSEKFPSVSEVLIGEHPLEASIARLAPPADSSGDSGFEDGFVVVLRDIAERKEIERLRDDFISTLTHDLRTPLLAAIQTMGFFVDGTLGTLSPRQTELIQMLIQSNREMLGLVNVLLEVYKYESGRQKLIFDTVNIGELLERVYQELDALAQSRKQTLTVQPGLNGVAVLGDKQELKRVFVNLIGNAINFTPKGGKISVSLEKQDKMVQICIQDNGRGIPAKDIPMLFQRFSQGTSKQRSSGSGLGLYLSRQIVEAHNGNIWVESEEGQGSRFYVALPLVN
jgi:signal transduction histidine kinase